MSWLRSVFPPSLPLAAVGLLFLGPHGLEAETVSLLVRFGLLDSAETRWDGSATVADGELLQARDWHPRPENRVDPSGTWEFATHKGINYTWRAYENLPDRPVEIYYWTPGVVLDIRDAPGAEVRIRTAQGDFSFPLREAKLAEPLEFLGGAAVVERVPTVAKLTGEDREDDFAAILGGPDGEVRVAWVAYGEGANEVLTRRFDGSAWGPEKAVTEAPGDIHLVKMGRLGTGAVWFVWAHQEDGNFDLYGRSLHAGAWSATERLSEGPAARHIPQLGDGSGRQPLAGVAGLSGRAVRHLR